jgi:hypothetical protein
MVCQYAARDVFNIFQTLKGQSTDNLMSLFNWNNASILRKWSYTRAVCKVRELTFLLRWWSLFRSTSLGKRCTSYNTPPTSRKRAADRWSLRNFLSRSSLFMVEKGQKSHGARSELNSVFCLEKVDRWNPIRISAIQSRSRPMRFLGFYNHEKGAPRQEISKWSTVCSMFSRSGWSVVRSLSLAKEGTSKKRPSPHLHKFRLWVIRWVHELCKRPSEGLEIFTELKIQVLAFWIMAHFCVTIGYQRFQHRPVKCWYPTASLHGVTAQKVTTCT